jgi:hypothetical protein
MVERIMSHRPNIFRIIESGDTARFIEVVDEAFKAAAREASFRAHALGIKVADGRAEEERRGRPVAMSTPSKSNSPR